MNKKTVLKKNSRTKGVIYGAITIAALYVISFQKEGLASIFSFFENSTESMEDREGDEPENCNDPAGFAEGGECATSNEPFCCQYSQGMALRKTWIAGNPFLKPKQDRDCITKYEGTGTVTKDTKETCIDTVVPKEPKPELPTDTICCHEYRGPEVEPIPRSSQYRLMQRSDCVNAPVTSPEGNDVILKRDVVIGNNMCNMKICCSVNGTEKTMKQSECVHTPDKTQPFTLYTWPCVEEPSDALVCCQNIGGDKPATLESNATCTKKNGKVEVEPTKCSSEEVCCYLPGHWVDGIGRYPEKNIISCIQKMHADGTHFMAADISYCNDVEPTNSGEGMYMPE